MVFAKKGDIVDGHDHNFDHCTYIVRGSVLIETLDAAGNAIKSVIRRANENFREYLIPAGVWHRITALEDNSLAHCIYSHRIPMALVERMTGDEEDEFNQLMARVIELGNKRFGDIVQVDEGWAPAYV